LLFIYNPVFIYKEKVLLFSVFYWHTPMVLASLNFCLDTKVTKDQGFISRRPVRNLPSEQAELVASQLQTAPCSSHRLRLTGFPVCEINACPIPMQQKQVCDRQA